MSDCRNGGRSVYHASTHSQDEDALTITAHFKDGSERPCTMNRMGRMLDYLESDGERYERVRECEMVRVSNTRDTRKCSACGRITRFDYPLDRDQLNYCPKCGARVVNK